MATVDVSTATVSKVIRREEFKGVTADRKAKAWALEPLGRYSQGDGVGGRTLGQCKPATGTGRTLMCITYYSDLDPLHYGRKH